MNFILVILVFFILTISGLGQAMIPPTHSPTSKGRIKTVIDERVYLVVQGKNVDPATERIGESHYDREGNLIQRSQFGNGEQRNIYRRAEGKLFVEALYFDILGNPSTKKSELFKANTEEYLESDLCAVFTVQRINDLVGKIITVNEQCADGSLRSTTLSDLGQKGELRRQIRTDILSRSWESVLGYNSADNLTEFKYTVIGKDKKNLTHLINYVDHKYDTQGNLIQMIASDFVSDYPGRLMFQFIEKSTITYHEN